MPVASEMIDGFWLFASIEHMECNTYLLVLSWGAHSIYLDVISTCTWRPHIAGIHRNHHFTIFQIIKYVQYQYTYLGSFIYANIDLVHWLLYISVRLFEATCSCLQFWTVRDMGLTNALNMVPFGAILASTLDVGIVHFILANFDLMISVFVYLSTNIHVYIICILYLYINICKCLLLAQYRILKPDRRPAVLPWPFATRKA